MELTSILTLFLVAIANASPHPRAGIPARAIPLPTPRTGVPVRDTPLPTPTAQHKNEIRQGDSPVWTHPEFCTNYNINSLVSTLLNPPETVSFNGTEFCSRYLQPYVQEFIYSTTTGDTITETSTSHTLTSTTTTYSSATTTTLLCASPRPSALCNLTGNAYDYFDLGWVQDIGQGVGPVPTLEDCYARCLYTDECHSFLWHSYGPGEWGSCDQFQHGLEGKIDPEAEGGGQWWERGCVGEGLLPEGCSTPSPPSPPERRTDNPDTEIIQIREVDKGIEKRDYTFPPYIEPITIVYLGGVACSCIITSAYPTETRSISSVITLHSSTSVTTTQTDVDVSTSYLSLSTAYSTV